MGHVGFAPTGGAVSLPRFLVAPHELTAARVALTGPQLHHLRARRLRVGSALVLADGMGIQRRGVVAAIDRHQAVIEITDEQPVHRDSTLQLTIAQALLKGDKLDWVIEKTTELGVSELVIFTSERTLGRVGSERLTRWSRVASSAAQQCQRSTLPVIRGLTSFDELLAPSAEAVRLFFWEERAGSGLAGVHRQHSKAASVLAVIGPEGGFSNGEARRAEAAGLHMVSLGPRILRAETAAVVAGTLCQFLWGDLGDDG